MSRDIVALVKEPPDPATAVAELRLPARAHHGTTYVYDTDGRMLVSVPDPVFVQVPGEVERLLGAEIPAPVWWVEVRAAGDLPGAAEVADQLARRLVDRHGGSLWRGAAG